MTRTSRRATLATVAVLACLLASIARQVTQADASPASPWPANPDWQQYVPAPSSPLIYPHSVTDVTGNVTNPQALTDPDGGQTTTLTRTAVGLQDNGPDSWPPCTTATASSTHAPSSGVTYAPSNALDGNDQTYWSNATAGSTDSWLEISAPAPVTLPGLTVTSSSGGVPVDFQIQTWDAATSSWVTQVSVANNSALQVSKLFPAPVTTLNVRIFITLAESSGYSRIAAVYPYYAPPTSLVLDYGKEVGGWPEFKVTGVTGSPTLLAGYSETLEYLTPYGDTTGGGSPGVLDPLRYDSYPVTHPQLIVNQFPQGGERYEMLTLTSVGSLTLSFARLRYNRYQGTASRLGGQFVSSNDLLNKIWYDGAYTINLSQLLPGTPGMDWVADGGALNVQGGAFEGSGDGDATGILKQGANWTNYSMSFAANISANQVGWVVRAQSLASKYLLVLDADNDTIGTPDTLVEEEGTSSGTFLPIASVTLPFSVLPEHWYQVRTVASGTTVTTFLNGQQIASFDTATLPSSYPPLTHGSAGFREGRNGVDEQSMVASAAFKNLVVQTPTGQLLYSNSLASQDAVGDFQLPVENDLPLMMADAKRDGDQGEWEADLSVEGPTLYDAVGTPQYMRGSLDQLGSYQLTSGFIPAEQYPATPVYTGPPIPGTVTGYASATYSMYWVINLASYYQYTGDTAFVRKEWPIVTRELAWDDAQDNSQGLLVTNATDGESWGGDHYGVATYYNAVYYRTLLDASMLARAIGHSVTAQNLAQQAASLKTAINQNLFNPQTGAYDIEATPGVGARDPALVIQDANVYPVLYGIAPASKVPGILNVLTEDLGTPYGDLNGTGGAAISPFMGSYDLWARFSAHDTAGAMKLLMDEWGHMATTDPASTTWEEMTPTGTIPSGYNSAAHGWSTGATAALSEYVLGIRPVAAGYRTWTVEPQPGSLGWAEGKVPTPHGPLAVKWGHETTQGRFVMQVQPPAGTAGTIGVPTFGRAAVVYVNGHLVWDYGDFQPAPGITGAQLGAHDITLEVNPTASRGGFLVSSEATGPATS